MTDIKYKILEKFYHAENRAIKEKEVHMELSILISNISRLCDENNISVNKMEKAAGLKKGFMDNLKKDSMPSVDKVVAVADYFQVSMDFLVGRQDFAPSAKLLEMPDAGDEFITVPMAAHSSTYTPIADETYADKRAGEFANAPDVDTEF